MHPKRLKPDEFKLTSFIEYIGGNLEELLYEYPKSISRVCLIDRDYRDVILFDEDYENIDGWQDYSNLLLDEEYALLLSVAKTNENMDKLEFIDGQEFSLSHYQDDQYQDNCIKDIGGLSLDMDHLIGVLIDIEEDDIIISLVNFEHGGQISQPMIFEVDDSGELDKVISTLINNFVIA